eukprot:scaffold2.g7119.t1
MPIESPKPTEDGEASPSHPHHESVRILGTGHVASFEIEAQEDHPRGVLGLPYAFSYLGWGIYTSYLLAALHEQPQGVRLNTYREMGEMILGPRMGKYLVGTIQYTLMVGLCITYSVTAGQSLKGIASDDCSGADCQSGISSWIVVFGVVQLGLSQVPDMHSLWWVSLLGAVMSVGYSTVAVVMSGVKMASGDQVLYDRTNDSHASNIFGTFNALGAVAFTFGGQAVLPEIQATLAKPPSTERTMMKAVCLSYVVVILAYYSVACTGYAAFGTGVSSDVLLNIKEPTSVMHAANMMVVIHVAAAWQVFAMPIFDVVETSIKRRMRNPWRPLVLRLLFRTAYVVLVTLAACMLPFFGDLMGLISVGLMPITFILPPIMWIKHKRPRGLELWANVVIAGSSAIAALFSLVGSFRNILVHASQFDPFE